MTGPENDRQRYVAALTAVGGFFGTFKAPFVGRFYDLASAITDLNISPRAAPLLQPVRTGKRGGDSSLTWRRRAHAVLGLEGLMAQHNCSEADALKMSNAYNVRHGVDVRHSIENNAKQSGRVVCGAKRHRDGHPCQAKSEPGKRRCRFHGGRSTGPRTEAGKARAVANLRNQSPG